VFSVLLAVAVSVMAQASSPPPPEATPSAPAAAAQTGPQVAQADRAPEKDPVICHREMPLGSRLPQKVCARRSAAEQQQRDSRRTLEDIQTRSRGPFATPQ
jgi:hypothetical protein